MIKILFLILTAGVTAYSQVELKANMGISLLTSPSLNDYLNMNFAPPQQKLEDFSTAVNFSAEAGYYFSENFFASIETAYLLNSYTFPITSGNYEFSYGVIMPTIAAYYVVPGEGYNFKFGGGVGLRFSSAEEKQTFVVPADYSSTGFGFLLKAEGNTKISNNFYANITADLRYDINGDLDSGGNKIYNNVTDENVNLNMFSAGIRLGVSFLF